MPYFLDVCAYSASADLNVDSPLLAYAQRRSPQRPFVNELHLPWTTDLPPYNRVITGPWLPTFTLEQSNGHIHRWLSQRYQGCHGSRSMIFLLRTHDCGAKVTTLQRLLIPVFNAIPNMYFAIREDGHLSLEMPSSSHSQVVS